MKITELFDSNAKLINDTVADIRKNCSQTLSAEQTLYKGILRNKNIIGDAVILDPTAIGRRSRNTQNYYTLLIDNLPNWSKYPKRSKSLIMSTNLNTAKIFGDIYRILPFNNAILGVCSHSDIWDSFRNVCKSIDRFNNVLAKSDISDYNYAEFLTQFFISKDRVVKNLKLQVSSRPITDFLAIANALEKITTKNQLVKYLNNLFDPTKNGFTTQKVDTKIIEFNREVWTSSKCYLIRYDAPIYRKLFPNEY